MWSSRHQLDLMQHSLPTLGFVLLASALYASATAFADTMPAPMASPGYKISTFATSPAGSSEPNSIAIVKDTVWIGYGDGGKPDGSGGAKSTIVEYSSQGQVMKSLTVVGHNDGMRLDPRSNKLWVLQNEDSNPNLVMVDPASGAMDLYSFAPTAHGGGYDDMAFRGGVIYISASNPTPDFKGNVAGPSLVMATVASGNKIAVKPVLAGMPKAVDITTGKESVLNLTDPDFLAIMPSGDILLDDQGDALLVIVRKSAMREPAVQALPLLGGVQVDDTVFATAAHGYLLVADRDANTVYRVDAPVWGLGSAFSASTGVKASTTAPITPAIPAYVGELDLHSGAVVPIVGNMTSPHGMAFVPSE